MSDDTKTSKVISIDAVRADLMKAEPAPPPPPPSAAATAGASVPAGAPAEPGGGSGDGDDLPPYQPWRPELPEDCPVRPVGVKDDTFYYLDSKNQLRALKGEKHGRLNIETLFMGDTLMLQRFWPKKNKDGDITGIQHERAAAALMYASAAQGIWNPFERVRGPGAWAGENGELVLHCGDRVLTFPGFNANGTPCQNPWGHMVGTTPGLAGRYVYPGDEPGPKPETTRQRADARGAGAELLAHLGTWHWKRGDLDARLLVGWIGAALIGGALTWRPAAWITGSRGTGKSTLHGFIKALVDHVVAVSDTSGAGLWQKIGHATLPVLVDEIEAETDTRRADGVIKLARQAASGGVVLRGGADHTATEFVVRSCFLFSSILVPPMPGQDASRIAFLELNALKAGHGAPRLTDAEARKLGSRLRRLMVDGWGRLPATIDIYRQALNRERQDARRADVFGTLLACAELLLAEGVPDPTSAMEWVLELEGATGGFDDEARDEELMLNKLMSTQIDAWRSGVRPTVGELIDAACSTIKEVDGFDPGDSLKALQRIGLRIEFGKTGPTHLLIANKHDGLMRIFEGTHWAGRPGASSPLVQAARRLRGWEPEVRTYYFAGVGSKVTRLPIALVWTPGAVRGARGLRDDARAEEQL